MGRLRYAEKDIWSDRGIEICRREKVKQRNRRRNFEKKKA
jgi:hypothetical protein